MGQAMKRTFNGIAFTRQWTEYTFIDDAREAAERIRESGHLVRIVKNRGHKAGPKYHRYTLYARRV